MRTESESAGKTWITRCRIITGQSLYRMENFSHFPVHGDDDEDAEDQTSLPLSLSALGDAAEERIQTATGTDLPHDLYCPLGRNACVSHVCVCI